MVENRREYAIRTRRELGMRADPAWVDHVAEVGRDGGMTLNIPLTEDELAAVRARYDRSIRAGAAFRRSALPGAAGAWVEPGAGGLVHLQLAHPDADDRAAAETIVAEHHAVIDLVDHSTRELRRVEDLVDHANRTDPDFAAAIVLYGIRVEDNVLHLQLRHDRDPAIPDDIQAARTAGTLKIEYTTARYHDD